MSLMSGPNTRQPLYTAAQRARRDATKWTLVQGILAPIQFVVFLISLALVLRYLSTGEGYGAANASILLKTAILYLIMVTGAIWEKVVFGQYLLAPAFFLGRYGQLCRYFSSYVIFIWSFHRGDGP